MALNRLEADLSIISKLSTNPGVDDGLSEEQLKAKFDEAANLIKDYLNNYLILQIDKVVDVEALLKDILDVTLSKDDKAANAAATGDAIRSIRSFFDKTVHSGNYVLKADGLFAAKISGDATVQIKGGEGVMQGNLFALNIGTYEDVKLLDGTYGLYRNDLIAVRCTKGEANALSYALVALTGANTSGEPVDPEYNQSDINADGTICDFPLYRITFDGVDIVNVEPLFETIKGMETQKLQFNNTVVPAASFVADTTYRDDYPYRAAVALEGVLKSMIPDVTFSVADAVSGNFAPVVESYNGGIYLYAADVPEAAVTIPTILLWRGNA